MAGLRIEAYHPFNNLLHLPHRKLQDQIDGLVLVILPLDPSHHQLSFLPISAGRNAIFGIIRVQNTQTHNLISIIDQFIDQPLEGILGVIVRVQPTQERP
jgi:hypothetical protein